MSAHPPYFANAEVLMLNPTTIDVDVSGRIGLYYPDKCHALAALISVHGQNDPIKVVKAKGKYAWRLVAGLHRLHACMSLGINVCAIEIIGRDDVALEQIQASENVDRRELEPLERALFVRAVATAARLRVLKEHGVDNDKALAAKAKARAGKVQYSELDKADEVAELAGDNLSLAYGWAEEAADALGMGKRDLQRSMRIHRMIIEPFPTLIDAFKDHPVAKVADSLLKIAAIKDDNTRLFVIEALLDGEQHLNAAMRAVGAKPKTAALEGYDKWTGQITSGISKLKFGDWSRFCPEFARHMSNERRVALRDALNEVIAENAGDAA